MGDEPPDDYFEAAAEVVEAARELDEARKAFRIAEEAHLKAFTVQRAAEKKLSEAVEKLKGANVNRGKGDGSD